MAVKNGATNVCSTSLARGDNLNLTGITDAVTAARSQTFAYTAANRLNSATGAYGTSTWTYDGVGNRTGEVSTPVGGSATTRTYTYNAAANKLANVKIGTTTERSFVHDAGGNITSDTRSGTAYV